jgi:hypothetical protein
LEEANRLKQWQQRQEEEEAKLKQQAREREQQVRFLDFWTFLIGPFLLINL